MGVAGAGSGSWRTRKVDGDATSSSWRRPSTSSIQQQTLPNRLAGSPSTSQSASHSEKNPETLPSSASRGQIQVPSRSPPPANTPKQTILSQTLSRDPEPIPSSLKSHGQPSPQAPPQGNNPAAAKPDDNKGKKGKEKEKSSPSTSQPPSQDLEQPPSSSSLNPGSPTSPPPASDANSPANVGGKKEGRKERNRTRKNKGK